MVAMVGDYGFAAVDIAAVCERAEVGRAHFDRCFADLEDCFLSLHAEAMEQLCGRVDAACDGRDAWHDRIWAAGHAAQSRRDHIVQRIADVLDGGRGEVRGERPMSRCTAEITAGAVYGTMMSKVESGSIERGEEFLPELIYLATMPYLGARAAEDELLVQPLR
jgi:AcrR family transcriptional regulator